MRTLLIAAIATLVLAGCSPPGQNTSTTKKKGEETTNPNEPRKPVFDSHTEGVAYVANSGSDTISMFDLATLEAVAGTVPTGHAPGNLARNPQNLIFFPARHMSDEDLSKSTPEGKIKDQFRSGSLWAIDPKTGNGVRQKGIVGDPDQNLDPVFVELSSDGLWAAVSDQGTNQVHVRDLGEDERKRNVDIDAGPGPFGIAFSMDGKFLAVASNDPEGTIDPDVVRIFNFAGDDSGPVEIAKIAVGDRPSQICSPMGSTKFYVTVSGSKKIVAIDAVTKAMASEWELDGEPQGITADPSGQNLYVTLQDRGEVLRIDGTTGQVTNRVTVGKEPWMVALDAHSGRLWVTNRGDDTVSVVSLVNFTLEKSLKTGKAPTGVTIVLNPTRPRDLNQEPPKVEITNGGDSTINVTPANGATADTGASFDTAPEGDDN